MSLPWRLNLSGSYSPKLASFGEQLLTMRYPAACCREVHSTEVLRNILGYGRDEIDRLSQESVITPVESGLQASSR